MSWTLHTLDLGEVELNQRRMVANADAPGVVRVPVQGWLLVQGDTRVVIDTGFRFPDILKRLGDNASGIEQPHQRLSEQLRLHGLAPADVNYVLHTHLHIDHAGQTDVFPMSTVAVVNRRELEYAVSGLSGPSYPPEDIKHFIDRLHTRGALWLLDLEATGGETVLPGLRCLHAGGHTEGSMLVVADTDQGVAVFCGDLIYSVRHQLLAPTTTFRDLGTSANHVVARRQEKAALKRMMQVAPRFRLFPSHDWPVWVENGQVAEGAEACLSGRAAGCWCQQTSLGYPDTDPERDRSPA